MRSLKPVLVLIGLCSLVFVGVLLSPTPENRTNAIISEINCSSPENGKIYVTYRGVATVGKGSRRIEKVYTVIADEISRANLSESPSGSYSVEMGSSSRPKLFVLPHEMGDIIEKKGELYFMWASNNWKSFPNAREAIAFIKQPK